MSKKRLDVLLVERELVESRQRAQALVLAGEVRVNGKPAVKPGALFPEDAEISLRDALKYVSRGGYKLEGALDTFQIDVRDKVCADVGASTGGFTDCLLQRGAASVYALDVGYGQIAWKLRRDARVVVMDRVNVRYLESLPEPISLATIDVSFISLTKILPSVYKFLAPRGEALALVKPQFEAGRVEVAKRGVVRDARIHRSVLEMVAGYAQKEGWRVLGMARAAIQGAEGNVEFFIWLGRDASRQEVDVDRELDRLFRESA